MAPVFSSHELSRAIKTAQNELLSRLVLSFEAFISSKSYSTWQHSMADTLRRRMLMSSSRTDQSCSQSHSLGLSMDSRESIQQLPSLATLSSASDPSSVLSASKVLFVDDSKLTVKLAGLSLANGGVTSVDYAANGHVALSMMKQRNYDVVVIDMHMPVMDGFEAVRLYREYESLMLCDGISNRSFSAISEDSSDELMNNYRCASPSPYIVSNTSSSSSSFPLIAASSGIERRSSSGGGGRRLMIIGMSQDSDDSTRRRAQLCGTDHFLPKPFTVQKLVAAVLQSRAAAASAEEERTLLTLTGLGSHQDDLTGLGSHQDDLGSSTMVQPAEHTVP